MSLPFLSTLFSVTYKDILPHWYEKAKQIIDEKTGYKLILLPPGTKLFKGTNLYTHEAGRGFYGDFYTAFNYAFSPQQINGCDAGKIIVIEILEPFPLFSLTGYNLE